MKMNIVLHQMKISDVLRS